MEYKAGDLHTLLVNGTLHSAEAIEETLDRARRSYAKHAWDDEPHLMRQYEADISLLLDMLRYERELAALPQMVQTAVELSIATRQGETYGDSE